MPAICPKAKETFDDAVKQEPDYPIYHYNLACTYAEMGQLDPAMQELQTAWKLRKNLGENERFPDPRQDEFVQKVSERPEVPGNRAEHGVLSEACRRFAQIDEMKDPEISVHLR